MDLEYELIFESLGFGLFFFLKKIGETDSKRCNFMYFIVDQAAKLFIGSDDFECFFP